MRSLIALLLGAWLTGTIVGGCVAAENFAMVDRLLRSSAEPFQKHVTQLGQAEARVMLRYLSSELNRYFFAAWGWIELALGAIVVIVAARTFKRRQFVIAFSVMLGLAAVMLFYLVPEMNQIGRALDFVPRQPPPSGIARFGFLHGAYGTLDLIKLLLGIWMAVALVRLPPVRRGQ